jgi:hypothetical protein
MTVVPKICSSFFPSVEQVNPRQFLLSKSILLRRKALRMVEASSSDVDLIRTAVALIGKRSAARIAECPPGSRVRAIAFRRPLLKLKLRARHRDPGHRLRANGSSAVGAVAIRLVDGSLCSLEPHLSAVTSASDYHTVPVSPLSLQLPADANEAFENTIIRYRTTR